MAEYIDIVVTAPPQIVDITAVIGGSGGGGGGAVDSVNGQTGVVVLDAGDVGADPAGSSAAALTSANNYTDSEITALSNATVSALNNKQDRLSQILTGAGAILIVPTNTARVTAKTYYIAGIGNFATAQADFPLTLSAAGQTRYVDFYGDAFNTVIKVEGTQGSIATHPTSPANCTYFGYVEVTDAGVGGGGIPSTTPIITTYTTSTTPLFAVSTDISITDYLSISALASAAQFQAPAVVDKKLVMIEVVAPSVPRALTYTSLFASSSTTTLPNTTIVGKKILMGVRGDASINKWVIIALTDY